ncbi:GntR family transcriptional regulator [Allostella humosa]|nr:GntR family transcriptional regulator [Stella humosa]
MDEPRPPASRHIALAAELTEEIAAGVYPVGGRFPTEQELQERFAVGRHTVREALKVMAEQGLLWRRRKTGTVVLAERPVSPYVHSLRDLRGLFDFAQSTRLTVHHEGYAALSDRTLSGFTDLPDKRWLRIAGLRTTRADDAPLCWSEVLVPERFVPDRDQVRTGERAMYEIVMEQFGLKLDHVEQEITAGELPRQFASLLRAEAEAAALIVRRRYVAHTGATFEISHNLYPASRYSVRSVLRQRV